MIELGSTARDTITGFEGIVVGRTEWLEGIARVGIQPQELHDGKVIETDWFFEGQVEVIDAKVETSSVA